MIFLNSASSAKALVLYLPFSGPNMKSSVHTERGQSTECILKSWKNTIFNEHPVYFADYVFLQITGIFYKTAFQLQMVLVISDTECSEKSCPIRGLINFSGVIIFYKSAGIRRKGTHVHMYIIKLQYAISETCGKCGKPP